MSTLPQKTGLAHKRFVFETVFDGEGVIVSEAPRPRRLVPAAEVDVLTEAAFRRGEQSAVARAEAVAASALGQIAADLAAAMPTLAAVAHEHRAGSAQLAMAAAGKIAGEALALFPEAPAVAALQSLAREVEAVPRLIVHAPEAIVERLQATLEQAAGAAGYPGQITVKAAPGMPPAAFAFDWGDGRAAFDPEAAAARVADALQTALAAEGLHGEPLTPAEGPPSERPTHG